MADNIQLQCTVVLKELCDLRDSGVGFGLYLRLAGVKVYAVDRNMAGRIDVVAHRLGVGDDLLFHALFFHDRQPVHVIVRPDLDPRLFALLLEHDGGGFVEVIVEDDISADLLQGVLDVPAYL